jgi:hypothetical protein
MYLTPEQAKLRYPDRPPPAPLKYAGEWVAWNEGRTQIIAHGENFGKVRAEAVAAGCANPLMQRVLGRAFVGSP